MIVRIANEGQYRVDSGALDEINEIDSRITAAMARNDGAEFRRLLGQMVEVVRSRGKPVPPHEIVESDLVLPSPDISLDEARRLFPGGELLP